MHTILENDQLPMPLWYSYKGGKCLDGFPNYLDNTGWDFLKEGEKLYPVILNEIETYFEKKGQPLRDYFNQSIVKGSGTWKIEHFYVCEKRYDELTNACPETEKFLLSIPGFISASVAMLSPNTEIEEHRGDSNGFARCQLGLKIPAGLPDCGFAVNGESRAWENGKWLIFSDALPHKAWNKTDLPRYILFLDVILPRYRNKQKEIAKNIRTIYKLQALLDEIVG
jgi:ornithine lipid ester-linked acyl 2-hydroxylase